MKIIWTFTLLMIPGVLSSISVTGYSGGGVSITCRYKRKYTENAKYFCREQNSGCADLIKTDKKNGEKLFQSGRFSLYDDTRAAVFTVIIRDLNEQDSDIYYCGTDIYAKVDSYTEVKLNVITGQKISAVTGYLGGNIIINYTYGINHKNHEKYICKAGADRCITLINTNRASEWKYDGRFSVHDDRSARILRVFIRELSVNDSGKYFIIVKVSEDYSFFSEFHLDIRNDTDIPKTTSSLLPSASSSSSSSSSASVFKTSTSNFTSESPNMLKGSSLIISLVLVLLVLIIISLLLLFLYKKDQSRESDSSSQAGVGKHEVVSHTSCDYEEIKDTHKQLPTNPSDSYVYATVQKATVDSQIFITSAEDLNYAVVNFQKKADCPDSVRLRNNQDYSEYAAVNHLTV